MKYVNMLSIVKLRNILTNIFIIITFIVNTLLFKV